MNQAMTKTGREARYRELEIVCACHNRRQVVVSSQWRLRLIGLKFRVQALRFRILGFWVWDFGIQVRVHRDIQDLELGFWSLGLWISQHIHSAWFQGSGFRVQGLEFGSGFDVWLTTSLRTTVRRGFKRRRPPAGIVGDPVTNLKAVCGLGFG